MQARARTRIICLPPRLLCALSNRSSLSHTHSIRCSAWPHSPRAAEATGRGLRRARPLLQTAVARSSPLTLATVQTGGFFQLGSLALRGESFAFETTLASRTFAPWLRQLGSENYDTHLLYVWLGTPRLAVRRVHERVLVGGHAIPREVIERRYGRSCLNLVRLYLPLATSWRILDNSGKQPRVRGAELSGHCGRSPLAAALR